MQGSTNKLLFFVICLLTSATLSAQKANVPHADEFTERGSSKISIKLDNADDLTKTVFFIDGENQLLFIDFEALGEELEEIRVVNDDAIIYTENVTELPMNTIYEVDLKQYEKGVEHRILLKTNFGILAKTFTIKE